MLRARERVNAGGDGGRRHEHRCAACRGYLDRAGAAEHLYRPLSRSPGGKETVCGSPEETSREAEVMAKRAWQDGEERRCGTPLKLVASHLTHDLHV
jgi:hypothetical protein